jgi:hypothetical protein
MIKQEELAALEWSHKDLTTEGLMSVVYGKANSGLSNPVSPGHYIFHFEQPITVRDSGFNKDILKVVFCQRFLIQLDASPTTEQLQGLITLAYSNMKREFRKRATGTNIQAIELQNPGFDSKDLEEVIFAWELSLKNVHVN